jgi:hypothetical protein
MGIGVVGRFSEARRCLYGGSVQTSSITNPGTLEEGKLAITSRDIQKGTVCKAQRSTGKREEN